MIDRRILLAPLVGLVVCGYAQKAYTLRLSPKVGKTYTYTMSTSGGFSAAIQFLMKAIKVDSSHVVTECRFGTSNAAGKKLEQYQKLVMTITFDRMGNELGFDVSGVDPKIAQQIKKRGSAGSASQATYPKGPVKIGQKWDGIANALGQKVKASYKLVKVERVAGMQIADVDVTETIVGAKLEGPTRMRIDLADGMLIDSRSTFTAKGKSVTVSLKRS
jgi:hypothetical protein